MYDPEPAEFFSISTLKYGLLKLGSVQLGRDHAHYQRACRYDGRNPKDDTRRCRRCPREPDRRGRQDRRDARQVPEGQGHRRERTPRHAWTRQRAHPYLVLHYQGPLRRRGLALGGGADVVLWVLIPVRGSFHEGRGPRGRPRDNGRDDQARHDLVRRPPEPITTTWVAWQRRQSRSACAAG